MRPLILLASEGIHDGCLEDLDVGIIFILSIKLVLIILGHSVILIV